MSLPVSRPAGRALLVGSSGCRTEPLERLNVRGFHCDQADDPYLAVSELARRPAAYQCVVLSLQSLYREELSFIGAIKRRWPHVDVWLTQTDGRASAMAEAMQLGADGLLTEDGLLRTAVTVPAVSLHRPAEESLAFFQPEPIAERNGHHDHHDESSASLDGFVDDSTGEPVLTADELRALLQEPSPPVSRRSE